MITFKEYFEQEESHETVALLPGGYKPPTKGHFNAFRYILQDADKGVVFIGKKERDGITADQAKDIWRVYSRYLDKPIDVAIADITPVKSVYDFADAHPNYKIIVGAGDKDEDVKRYEYFQNNVDKYPLVHVIKIPMQSEGISGTQTRAMIADDIETAVDHFAPEELSVTDRVTIKNILLNHK